MPHSLTHTPRLPISADDTFLICDDASDDYRDTPIIRVRHFVRRHASYADSARLEPTEHSYDVTRTTPSLPSESASAITPSSDELTNATAAWGEAPRWLSITSSLQEACFPLFRCTCSHRIRPGPSPPLRPPHDRACEFPDANLVPFQKRHLKIKCYKPTLALPVDQIILHRTQVNSQHHPAPRPRL